MMIVLLRNLGLLAGVVAIILAPGYLATVFKWGWSFEGGILTRLFVTMIACYAPGFVMIALMKARRFHKAVVAVLFAVFVSYRLMPFLF
jgi:hypothetical protein